MRPVHEFQANFGQAEPETESQSKDLVDLPSPRESDSSVRNLCLVWTDGRKAFFNYAYLVAGDLTVQDGTNVLLLSFGSYTVVLKGYRLAALFDALLEHSPKTVTAVNPRYLPQHDVQNSVVIEIIVKSE